MNYYAPSWEDRARDAATPHLQNVANAKQSLLTLNRDALEAIAEAAITLLDEMSDPDEDHCLAGDDGCGRYWSAAHGRWLWGTDAA